jgi:hypothetical protein
MLLGPSIDESKGILAYGGIVLSKNGRANSPGTYLDTTVAQNLSLSVAKDSILASQISQIRNLDYDSAFGENEQALSPVLASLEFIVQQKGKEDSPSPILSLQGRGEYVALELTDVKIIDTEGRLIPVTVQNQAYVKIAPPPPKTSALAQNYPNPFNPETWIPFKLADNSHVEINIYNVKGQLVKTLDLGVKEAGYYMDKISAAHWDGRSKTGERVASGLYFYTIKAGKFIATRRMVMVK